MISDSRVLTPYVSARSLCLSGEVFLDANESQAPGEWRRYPERQDEELCEQLAQHYGVPRSNVLYDRGLDEIISLVMRAFCPPGSAVKIYPPTYGMYAVEAAVLGLEVRKVPLDDTGLVPLGLERENPGDPALVILCRPNNPLGTTEAFARVEELARIYQGIAPIFIDEAYAEFMAPSESSALALIEDYDVVIGRTFSKAMGLAGLRFGCALASARLIERLAIVQKPYPLATPVISYLKENLASDVLPQALLSVAEVARQKPRWERELSEILGLAPFKSGANFLCFSDPRAPRIFEVLRRECIITRVFNTPAPLWRVTIGTSAQLDNIARVLRENL